jgi:uncharacterized protein (DUF1697 family)
VRQVVLLRGINLGATNRVSMSKLREAFEQAGFSGVRTYLQSGNVVLTSGLKPQALAQRSRSLLAAELGLEVDVVVRTQRDLTRVVRANPLGEVATNPKRYQVTFLAEKPSRELLSRLQSLAAGEERVVASGREIYAWHPGGVARSKLWAELAGRRLGVVATSRNWTTVESLLELAAATA